MFHNTYLQMENLKNTDCSSRNKNEEKSQKKSNL